MKQAYIFKIKHNTITCNTMKSHNDATEQEIGILMFIKHNSQNRCIIHYITFYGTSNEVNTIVFLIIQSKTNNKIYHERSSLCTLYNIKAYKEC